ncbi:MAG TPA: sigma D regulator [Spongiibacteraceae bacterium]|nr:sigma D regulator [Spongiibacteraceae bacterium]
MLENCDIRERWSGVNKLIERWLAERQAVIVQFCAISGVHELSPQSSAANRQRLQKYCQLLLDYVSAGHFEVYYELLREAEAFQDGSADAATALMPEINATTAQALDFSDKYAESEQPPTASLAKDLSRLGEILAERFDYEDRLINAMHSCHREQVA